ncbi:MAG: 4-alpha-glucanotransferase [Clostridia bacterium]|nr:4-alpha-glucanotransferase [Clostridia bacterium]
MKRSSGVLMHVSSLWGDHCCGSFGKSALQWVDFLAKSGFTYWQVLPFCMPDEFNSPYKSFSTFSVNPYFVDIDILVEDGLLTPEEACMHPQTSPYRCEFDGLFPKRYALLSLAADRFAKKEGNLKLIDDFFKKFPHTDSFCRFMALKEANGGAQWTEWTQESFDASCYTVWRFIQYTAITQWLRIKSYAEAKGIKIIGDIPMYVALDSSDVWASPKMFKLDKSNRPDGIAGVPPDYFSADGQVWGNPLYSWKEMKKDGYAWWRARMEFMLTLFDGVRIDHFRALESYFSIPYGDENARRGKWIKGPGLGFIKALKETCGDSLIIAEDLGDINDEVRRLVKDSGYPGMRVLQFGFLSDDNSSEHLPHNYCANCVAYTGTHDNNTLLGYVWELDQNGKRRITEYFDHPSEDWDNCYGRIITAMLASHADTVIFPVQDLLRFGADTRMNTPGSSKGNWSYRITFDQLSLLDSADLLNKNKRYARI